MTTEGPTGAPLRQQIAEAIHATLCEVCHQRVYPCDEMDDDRDSPFHMAADAVVALLNLTEERRETFVEDMQTPWGTPIPSLPSVSIRYVSPWLHTPPDTNRSEPA